MKNLSFTILFLSFFSAAFAGNGSTEPVEGETVQKIQVLDYSNLESLAGAAIHFEEIDKTIYADFDGFVSLEDIPSGDYHLIIKLVSYSQVEVSSFTVGRNQGLTKLRLKSVSL